MKSSSFSYFVAALLSAGSLCFSSGAFAGSAAEPVNLRIEVDRPVLPADSAQKAIIKVALDGIRLPRPESRPPVNLALVLDRSGSMHGDKLQQAKAAAIEALHRLEADDLFSLVAYDTAIETLIPAGRVGDGRELEDRIRSIRAGGNTALYGGVSQGAAELRKHLEDRRYIHRLILLSDGLANEGPSTPDDLGRLGSALLKEGISVTTIGLGLGFNEDLMTRLAQKSDGNTYFVESSRDLPRIFNEELGDVLNIVARQITLEIVFPDGIRPVTFVGREGVIRGQKAEMTLNQLYGGQEKFALVEVEVPSNKSGMEREIASAQLRFENALTQRKSTLSARRSVKFDADHETVTRSANLKVQNDYAVNVMAVAKDKAVEFVDKNRRSEAANELRTKAAELQSLGATYSNSTVVEYAKKQAAEADRLERGGLNNAERKMYRAENAQTKNQQGQKQ
jgi:Ca-activated chloride channel family protein